MEKETITINRSFENLESNQNNYDRKFYQPPSLDHENSINIDKQLEELNKKYNRRIYQNNIRSPNENEIFVENEKIENRQENSENRFLKGNIEKNQIEEFLSNINEKIVVEEDPWLRPFSEKIIDRVKKFKNLLSKLNENEGFFKFCKGYEEMGFIVMENGILFKEYAPGAKSLSIVKLILKSLEILITGIETNIYVIEINSDSGQFFY